MYTEVTGRIKEELHNVEFAGITTDIWTSVSYYDYLSLTIHYLDTNFCLHHCCLEVVQFPVSHTVQNICQFLSKLVSDWDVSQNVVAVLRDNCRIITAGLEMSSFEHIPYLAHTFHLGSKDGLPGSKIVTNLVSQSRRLAGHFKHSVHDTQILKKCQMTTVVPLHRLIQNELTKWNSSLNMLKTLQEQKSAILLVGWELDLPELRRQQWTLINNIIPVFNIFDSAMLQVSSTNVTSAECTSAYKVLYGVNVTGLVQVVEHELEKPAALGSGIQGLKMTSWLQ
ncbi:hypothetical protein PR048_013535 [Dryococelus australis]|uniref:Uncharacterized protein n=1 Tax=Dryococelus australis TaxID=614101 RepID=A0ABQ9HT94_9NEOP|nr:hypothetical protein PR048_013535 [Dryococelus australis]